MRKYLYTKTTKERQGSLWFSHEELGLDLRKMFVTEVRYPDVYSDTGFINLGDEKHFHNNAMAMASKILRGTHSSCLYFVPLTEKPFVCYLNEEGTVDLKVVGYFDYAKTVFEKFGYDHGYAHTGLFEEVNPRQWDIIEE